jgi:hypothetical protein
LTPLPDMTSVVKYRCTCLTPPALLIDAPLTADEVQACVERLKNHKAGNPAEEGVVNELLIYGGPAMISMLHRYCSLMWCLSRASSSCAWNNHQPAQNW